MNHNRVPKARRRPGSGGAPPWSIADYRARLGWHVEPRGDQAWLQLGSGIVGASVPARLGPPLAAALAGSGESGPVLELGSAARWIFLADANGYVPGWEGMLSGVEVLGCPAWIPVPASGVLGGRSRWVAPPDARHRWLPTLASIIALARRDEVSAAARS
ncbi:hypothetical protein [Amycolatopsis thermophila]|uniref:DNA primase/polymerase bifunctional N-terminal domain-containing protein n=1 Tax=Amycolatopsis thermophila TaxID=206084 RepID=A0ABU0F5H9_9PSEU|nr:hypothetical protein [Amycolatopsis thermophila]MDQ0382846.1 hypothetical protein [Amycolatopsis thermophila]